MPFRLGEGFVTCCACDGRDRGSVEEGTGGFFSCFLGVFGGGTEVGSHRVAWGGYWRGFVCWREGIGQTWGLWGIDKRDQPRITERAYDSRVEYPGRELSSTSKCALGIS